MAKTLPTTILAAAALLAGLLLAGLLGAAAAAPAEAAVASGSCSGVTITPSTRTVRRNGRVQLEGQACGASSSASGGSAVQVKIKAGKRWATVANTPADQGGSYSVCAPVRVPRKARVVQVRATSSSGATGTTTLRVSNKGASGCDTGGQTISDDGSQGGGGSYVPPPPEQGNPDCPLSEPNSNIDLTLPSSCTQVASDTASNPNPIPFWGHLDCASDTRHQQLTSGGDTHATGNGQSQGNGSFRRLTTVDGDDVWGERCEMGMNDSAEGPTTFYHEGQRRVTFASVRMPNSSPISNPNWRNVLQMKQAQPYVNPVQASIFEVQVREGRWFIGSNWEGVWDAPATQNTWTRFAFDIVYSQDPSKGSIKVYVDLNSDGDSADAGEQSPRVFKQTLQVETPGGDGPIPVGQSIPSHLRAGIYQNSNYSCPSGCSVDIDNVQVYRP